MRICPRCGYVDNIAWRPAMYHQEFSFAHREGLELLDPEIVAALMATKRGDMVRRGPYLYWRARSTDTVRRCWVEDYRRVRRKGSWMERPRLYRQATLDP